MKLQPSLLTQRAVSSRLPNRRTLDRIVENCLVNRNTFSNPLRGVGILHWSVNLLDVNRWWVYSCINFSSRVAHETRSVIVMYAVPQVSSGLFLIIEMLWPSATRTRNINRLLTSLNKLHLIMPNHAVWSFQSNQNARFVYIPEAKEGIVSKLLTRALEMTNWLTFLFFLDSLSCFSSVFGKFYAASGRF